MQSIKKTSASRATKFEFTTRRLSALQNHDADSPSRSAEYSDQQVTGLKLTVGKSGTKTFGFRYKYAGGGRYARIGIFPAISLEGARKAALAMRAIVDQGGDPLAEHDRVKAEPTFAEFVAEQYLPWAKGVKRSIDNDTSKFNLHLLPKFGKRKLSEITRREIEMHHVAIRDRNTPATANRHLALLSGVYRVAIDWRVVERNPCLGIKQFRETNGRQRYLSPDEIRRLYEAMAKEPNQTAVAALKLLLLTGTRRQEALGARWEDVNLDASSWTLPRTKNGKVRCVSLNSDAKQLLEELPSRGNSQWLFPGRNPAKSLVNPRKAFTRVLAAAGIEEHVRIHDLRHSFASLAVNAGVPLYTVQSLLGHSSPTMTQRYAHLQNATMRKATQDVADAVSRAVAGAPAG